MFKFHSVIIVVALMVVLAIAIACGPSATSTPVIQTVVVNQTAAPQVVTTTPSAPGANALPDGSIKLNGAGATFPLPVYTQWNFAYKFADPSTSVNYQGIGSGGGKKGMVDGTIDFAGSDSLLSGDEYAAAEAGGRTLQMFPTLAGAVVPIANIPDITKKLTIDGPTLADIYNAKITNWNDPALAALNPEVTLPDQPISAVHRADGSGTTEIFTKYLSTVSEDWKNGPGAGSAVEWPVDVVGTGIGGRGNPGVAAAVQSTPFSIGYVELSFAKQNSIPFMDMVNAAGDKVTANTESLASAIADFGDGFDDSLTISSISNGPGAGSWPIAGYTYMIVDKDMAPDPNFGCAKPQKLLDYIYWFNTNADAGAQAGTLGYSVLPEAVRAKVFEKLATIKCDGQALRFGADSN